MANETTVYMVRHGETDANLHNRIQGQTDVPLNANGLKQAELVGKRLRNNHYDAIYSSDLCRASVTASSIAGEREIIFTGQLREWNLGLWQGKYITDIAELFPDEHLLFKSRSLNFKPSGGESTCEFSQRVRKFMDTIAAKHEGQTVLCVTHGGVLRAFLASIMELNYYPNSRMDNTAVSCFRTSDNGKSWQLISWNDTSHLDGNFVFTSVW